MIKIIIGFRDDQYVLVPDEEVHKAYYLFNHPEVRSVFSNGVILVGKNIQGIEPAYNETMGWNPTHKLTGDDWNDLRKNGVDTKLRNVLSEGRRVALLAAEDVRVLELPLSEASQKLLK